MSIATLVNCFILFYFPNKIRHGYIFLGCVCHLNQLGSLQRQTESNKRWEGDGLDYFRNVYNNWRPAQLELRFIFLQFAMTDGTRPTNVAVTLVYRLETVDKVKEVVNFGGRYIVLTIS